MIEQVLGALKDPKDDRDYKIKAYLKVTGDQLPVRLDVSGIMMPVRNQGGEGSCVSFAAAGFKEFQEKNFKTYLAPRFLTDRIQKDADSGAYPRDAMEVLLKEGVSPEMCQPYVAREASTPCQGSVDLAKENKIKAYARLYTIEEMKKCLYENGAFLASFLVTDTWFKPVGGLVIPEGKVVGGHAVCIVGYDDATRLLKFRNSWGRDWGRDGYGYLPYVSVGQYLMDAWSSVDIPDVEEEKVEPIPVPKQKTLIQALVEFILGLFRRKNV
jgi:C1A family cysteine protease